MRLGDDSASYPFVDRAHDHGVEQLAGVDIVEAAEDQFGDAAELGAPARARFTARHDESHAFLVQAATNEPERPGATGRRQPGRPPAPHQPRPQTDSVSPSPRGSRPAVDRWPTRMQLSALLVAVRADR